MGNQSFGRFAEAVDAPLDFVRGVFDPKELRTADWDAIGSLPLSEESKILWTSVGLPVNNPVLSEVLGLSFNLAGERPLFLEEAKGFPFKRAGYPLGLRCAYFIYMKMI